MIYIILTNILTNLSSVVSKLRIPRFNTIFFHSLLFLLLKLFSFIQSILNTIISFSLFYILVSFCSDNASFKFVTAANVVIKNSLQFFPSLIFVLRTLLATSLQPYLSLFLFLHSFYTL